MEDRINSNQWTTEPPTEEGKYWFFGDEEFGCMGGHWHGSILPRRKLMLIELQWLGSEEHGNLVGVSNGRFVYLVPFDFKTRTVGYIGVWQKAILPEEPNDELFDKLVTNYDIIKV